MKFYSQATKNAAFKNWKEGESQTSIAERLGVHVTTVCKWFKKPDSNKIDVVTILENPKLTLKKWLEIIQAQIEFDGPDTLVELQIVDSGVHVTLKVPK